MIQKIHLEGVRSHRSTTLELGKLTCLVGPNGCGKSTVLEVIGLYAQDGKRGDAELWLRRGAAKLEVSLELEGSEVKLQFEAASWTQSKAPGIGPLFEAFWGSVEPPAKLRLRKAQLLRLSWEVLRQPSYSHQIPPQLQPNGALLASVVTYLLTTEPARFEALLAQLKAVVPTVERIRSRPARVVETETTVLQLNDQKVPVEQRREVIGQELVFDFKGAAGVSAAAVSEGTLRSLAILTALAELPRGGIVLLDDIEQGLHPGAQVAFMAMLKKLVEENDLQILFTTHSPYVVDQLEPEQVWVFGLDGEGATVARRLSEHPDATRALEVLTTGEFWSAEGESWVASLGEVPSAE